MRLALARRWSAAALGCAALFGLAACGGDATGDPLVARGRGVYLANCSACHGSDPARAGAIGPAMAGASRALLEARLLRGEYPPGYTPQQTGGAMPLFPQLEPEIDALHAFLAEAADEPSTGAATP